MKINIRTLTIVASVTLLMAISVITTLPTVKAAPAPHVSTIGGKDAQQLGSLITQLMGSTSTLNVLVISGLTNQAIAQADSSLAKGDIIVTIGQSLFATPVIHMSSMTSTFQVDTQTGATTAPTVTSTTTDQISNPIYLVTVAQKQGSLLHISFYGLQIDSSSLYQTLLQSSASEAAALTSPVTTVTPAGLGDVNSQWTKKYDVSYTDTVNSQGDYFYARFEIYQLNYYDTVSNTEYWRTDIAVDHLIKSYSCGGSHCGPYLNIRREYESYIQGENYQYDPVTTNADTTASVSIGFDVSNTGGSVGVQYQWSWTNPGVRIDTTADRPNNYIQWQETFNGPNYFYYPFSISGPTAGAYNSYQAEPTLVVRTPYQSGYHANNLYGLFETYNDYLSCNFLCITYTLTRYTSDYVISYDSGQLVSMFAPQPTSISINYAYVNDCCSRSVGVAIDRTLPVPWWSPYQSGYEVNVISSTWTYNTNAQLARGSHYLQTAVSGFVSNYEWYAKVYINGVLTAQGYVGRNQILQANFNV